VIQRQLALAVVLLLPFSGCVPGDGACTAADPAGFFSGIWHGWIAPISLVWGFFNESVRVYEPHNTGWWYDFGYYMAIISGFGGLSFLRGKGD
jgi:hypothetical protein